VTLEWTATDLDDPPWLLYIIQYSPDQGENWHSLIVNHAGPGRGISESLPLDLRGQPGSDGQNAFLRVLASDGYNTGLGTSQPFGVAPRAPDVFIAAPGEGEWYAAGEPIVLRGDALDPEDIVLEDDALTWSLGGSVIDTGANSIVGLAPGEHSLTLAAIDSDGLRGSATVTFTVGALDIPLAPTLVLDGQCSDMGYNTTALPLSPYADASRAFAFTARTDDHLWVCLQGLQGAGDFAGLQVDVDNSQETAVQLGDLGFFVKLDGTPRAMEGDGSNWALIQPTGMEAHISGDSSGWSAELRIDASTLGGWNRRVAMGIGHYGSGVNAVWPHSAALEQPQSWAQTNLVLGETLELRAMSPVSTTMLSSVLALTVTGANFQRDSVVVWNTFPLSTTYVSSSTLTATGPGFLTNLAGEHTVHVAPSSAHELGSNPLPFMVVYPQPSITNLNPSSARWNDNGFTLIVDGSGFDVDSTVLWNGEPRPTLFISSSRLNATISAEDLAAARSVSIRVANPVPNAGSSEVATFKVRRTYEQYLPFVRSDD
jgi:hypothetical protein